MRWVGRILIAVFASIGLLTVLTVGALLWQLDRLFEPDADLTFAPGRGGGTNALVVRVPGFRVDYHGASYRDHRRICEDVGASVRVVDSFRLSTDVDEPADLVEVLLHTDGRAAAWLRDAGFRVETTDGRVRATRE